MSTQLASHSTDEDWDDLPDVKKWVSPYPEWTAEALCRGMDDTLFFGASDPTVRPQYTVTEIKKARKLCAQCPVARLCLTGSMEQNDEYGVFAGSTRTDRTKMQRRIDAGGTTLLEEVNNFITWLKEGYRV